MLAERYEAQVPTIEVTIPESYDMSEMFWLDPARIDEVNHLITTANLPTMVLGAQSRARDHEPVKESLTDILVDPDEPQAAAFRRAIEVGFMYGTMLPPLHTTTSLVDGSLVYRTHIEQPMRHIAEQVNHENVDNERITFMALRDLEVLATGSDVLAFSLAASQDHVRQVLTPETEGATSESDTIRLQTNFYAGALAGALTTANPDYVTSRPESPILRSFRKPVESASMVIEMEQSDNLMGVIDYYLRHKHHMVLGTGRGRTGHPQFMVGANFGNLQFAPNQVSAQVFLNDISRPDGAYSPGQLDYLVVGDRPLQESGKYHIQLYRDIENTLESLAGYEGPTRLIGFGSGTHFLSRFNNQHPVSDQVAAMVAEAQDIRVEDLKQLDVNEFTHAIEMNTSKKIMKAALAAGLAVSLLTGWLPEIQHYALTGETDINWLQGLTTNAIFVCAFAGLRKANRLLHEPSAQSIHVAKDRVTIL